MNINFYVISVQVSQHLLNRKRCNIRVRLVSCEVWPQVCRAVISPGWRGAGRGYGGYTGTLQNEKVITETVFSTQESFKAVILTALNASIVDKAVSVMTDVF